MDVAKASGVVCMRTPDPARPGRFVNRIWEDVPAMRARIAELGRELLVRNKVQMVTLESTRRTTGGCGCAARRPVVSPA